MVSITQTGDDEAGKGLYDGAEPEDFRFDVLFPDQDATNEAPTDGEPIAQAGEFDVQMENDLVSGRVLADSGTGYYLRTLGGK